MIILLRQIKRGLYLAPNGWTTEKSEARRIKSVKEALRLMEALGEGPLELYYDVGDEGRNFTVPLQTPVKSRRPRFQDSSGLSL